MVPYTFEDRQKWFAGSAASIFRVEELPKEMRLLFNHCSSCLFPANRLILDKKCGKCYRFQWVRSHLLVDHGNMRAAAKIRVGFVLEPRSRRAYLLAAWADKSWVHAIWRKLFGSIWQWKSKINVIQYWLEKFSSVEVKYQSVSGVRESGFRASLPWRHCSFVR